MPSEMLTRQNGVRTAISTKITAKFESPNQTIARIAQPTDGKALRTGVIRSRTIPSATGQRKGLRPARRRAASPPRRRRRHAPRSPPCRQGATA